MKAMTMPLVIVVASVVILVTALILIGVFTRGLGTFQNIFNPWAEDSSSTIICNNNCQQACLLGSTPPSTVKIGDKTVVCPPCPCATAETDSISYGDGETKVRDIRIEM